MQLFDLELNQTGKQGMSENYTDHSDKANKNEDAFREQFEALEIPPNIDPRLLALWMERERLEIEKKQHVTKQRVTAKRGRKLSTLFASYIGIFAMGLSIVLGFVHGREVDEILPAACQIFFIYTVFGYLIGWIMEYCVTDSVESLLREIVRRGDAAAAEKNKASQNEATSVGTPGTVEAS